MTTTDLLTRPDRGLHLELRTTTSPFSLSATVQDFVSDAPETLDSSIEESLFGLRSRSQGPDFTANGGNEGHRYAASQRSQPPGVPEPTSQERPLKNAGPLVPETTPADHCSAKDDECEQVGPRTRTGKVRKRLQLACANCRRRKTKCTGELPACRHCLRIRIPCVYKTTRQPAAPRTSYMAMLDRQLQDMESRILNIVSIKGTSSSDLRPKTTDCQVVGPERKQSSPVEDFQANVQDFNEIWTQESIAERGLGEAALSSSLVTQEKERKELMTNGLEALPSPEIQEHLSETFFTHLYGQPYSLLHEPSYMAKLRAGELPPVLVLTICGVAARFSSHPYVETSPKFLSGEQWASRARAICASRLDYPNLTLVTCLVLLSLHDFGTCYGGRSWILGGQAIRMAFDLHLHQESTGTAAQPDGPESSLVDREIRRRIMWACFIIDRFNSSSTARPIFIRDELISVEEPIQESVFQLRTAMTDGELREAEFDQGSCEGKQSTKVGASVAAYSVRAVALWGKIILYLNQGGRENDPHPIWHSSSALSQLRRQAEDLSESLPASLAYGDLNMLMHDSDNTAGQFFFLHATIQQNLLAINHAVMASPRGVPRASMTQAVTRAFASAARISNLLAAAESRAVNAPFVGYSAFASTMVQLEGIFSGNHSIESSTRRRLTSNIKYLHKMKHHWGVFHWMLEEVRERYRYLSDRAQRGQCGLDEVDASSRTITNYSEWFERYPRGVSQSDFVEPADEETSHHGDDAVLEQKPDWITVGEYLSSVAPTQDQITFEGVDDDPSEIERQVHDLERLLMDLDESAQVTAQHNAVAGLAEGLEDTTQLGGDALAMQNVWEMPGAYRGFLDGFSADHANLFGFPPRPTNDGLFPWMSQAEPEQSHTEHESHEGEEQEPEQEGDGQDGEDVASLSQMASEVRQFDFDPEVHQIDGFEGCGALAVLKSYVGR